MAEPQTVFDVLAATASRFGDRVFLQVLPETAQAYGIPAEEITYREMHARARRRADAYHAAGYHIGQRVGLLLHNRPAYFEHWFALNALGVSVVPINPDLKVRELAYLVAHSEIAAAVVLPERQADINAAARAEGRDVTVFGPDDTVAQVKTLPPGPSQTVHTRVGVSGARSSLLTRDTECALLYTSGTTGQPKGCVLTNTYFHNSGHWYLTVGGRIQLSHGRERMLTPLPLFHMNAMATSTMTMLMSGGCLIVLDRFHPKSWWQSVRESRATIVHYLGVMPPILMAAPAEAADRDHQVKLGFGAGVDRRLHGAFEQRFGFPLVEAWAMTETGGGIVIADNHEPRRIGTSCFGKAGPESDIRIVGDDGRDAEADANGELLVRRAGSDPRHGFFREYLKDADATAEAWRDGWFHTGDVVRRDADGYLYFVDRKKNVIRRSGENISAVDVESLLLQHPAIAAAGVAPVADDVRGEEVFAAIVLRDPFRDEAATAAMIVGHCLERSAYYKAPGYIAFVSALPLTSTQKIQRGTLKVMANDLVVAPTTHDTRALKKRTV
jgi:acyl-CoA synthetase (AMP-forming)/AMP-acid ligase II